MTWLFWVTIAWTFACSYALTSLARRVAVPAGFVDKPDGGRKRHQNPTPLLGGPAIYLSVLLGLAALTVVGGDSFQWADLQNFSPVALFGSAGLFCLIGLWDDRLGMRARTKFFWQIAASLPFAIWGETIQSVNIVGLDIALGGWGILFTVFWLVACANIINLVDGLDGLAGTVGLVVVLTIAALSILAGRDSVALVSLTVAAGLIGFLVHNWPPAKIFMGDSGSLTVGFLVGALAIEAALKQATGFALIAPLVMISVPIFDTSMAILRRKLSGKSIGQADRGHIHHRLQDRGLSRLQVLLSLAALCVVMGVAAVVSAYFHSDIVAVVICLTVLAVLIVGRVFGHFESLLFLSHVGELGRLTTDTLRAVSSRMLVARLSTLIELMPQDCWDQLCTHAARKGVSCLELTCVQSQADEAQTHKHWDADSPASKTGNEWEFRVTVRRDADTVTTLRMAGEFKKHYDSRRTNDLLLLADRFCWAWPIDAQHEDDAAVAFPHVFDPDDTAGQDKSEDDENQSRRAA